MKRYSASVRMHVGTPNSPIPPYHQRITPNHSPINSLYIISVRRKFILLVASPAVKRQRDYPQPPILGTTAIKPVEVIPTNGTFNVLSCPIVHALGCVEVKQRRCVYVKLPPLKYQFRGRRPSYSARDRRWSITEHRRPKEFEERTKIDRAHSPSSLATHLRVGGRNTTPFRGRNLELATPKM